MRAISQAEATGRGRIVWMKRDAPGCTECSESGLVGVYKISDYEDASGVSHLANAGDRVVVEEIERKPDELGWVDFNEACLVRAARFSDYENASGVSHLANRGDREGSKRSGGAR